jgi:iron complex outermembrane receptor protein
VPAPVAATTPKPVPPANEAKDEKDFYSKAPIRLEEVEISETRPSALTMAPTASSLDVYQPQSVIDLAYISNHLPPTADYSTIANMSPSVANIVSNGPGLSEARRSTMRGFAQNQYNVTYDGIPFQDSDDLTHHSTSYFPAKMIGRVTVDRGPGEASGLGIATFGGTIGLTSKDPRTDLAIIPTMSYGSYNTILGHIEADTGSLKPLDGASAIASYQYLTTDGYQTDVTVKRTTGYVKYLQPIGKNTTVTLLSNYNDIKWGLAQPVSQALMDQYGRNFALSDDPRNLLYKEYSKRKNRTDFEYIGLDSAPTDSIHVNAKVYTYYYNTTTNNTSAYGGGTLNSKTGVYSKPWEVTDGVPDNVGRIQHISYRSVGETFNVSWDNPYGVLKFGAWHDYQHTVRQQIAVDYTKGGVPDYNPALGSINQYLYRGYVYNTVDQLFAEYDWRINKDLTLNAGVKDLSFERKYEAPINQTTLVPLDYTQKQSKPLGSASINYSIQNEWTVYAQAAQGFLAPNQNQLYVIDPSHNKPKPQETMNYQVGTVYKKERVNAAFDLYWIDYQNYPYSYLDSSLGQTIVVMSQGAYFSGAEAEITYYLGNGISAYANGSINNAKFKKSKVDVNLVPATTGVLGLEYEGNGFFSSIVNKYTGSQKVYNPTGFNPDDASTIVSRTHSGGYSMVNFTIGYGTKLSNGFLKSVKIKLEVNNILDRKVQVIDSYGTGGFGIPSGTLLYAVLPTRNYFFTISGEF